MHDTAVRKASEAAQQVNAGADEEDRPQSIEFGIKKDVKKRDNSETNQDTSPDRCVLPNGLPQSKIVLTKILSSSQTGGGLACIIDRKEEESHATKAKDDAERCRHNVGQVP